jgi:hypothetical protein
VVEKVVLKIMKMAMPVVQVVVEKVDSLLLEELEILPLHLQL